MKKQKKKKEVVVLLHNIRSTHNVGSIFRTSDSVGVTKIYLSGYTAIPVDKFGRSRKDIAKVALGAEKSISWEYIEDPKKIIKKLKNQGGQTGQKHQVISLEQTPESLDYKKVKVNYPVLFIVGNEVEGVPEDLLVLSDIIAEIPMVGNKESLNVSVAFGIALFRILGV